MSLVAAIPYRTFPDFQLGPLTVRTFGLMVALGILLAVVVGSRYAANRGMDPEEYTSLATKVAIVGLIGSRITWVLSHMEAIDSPIDVIAVWEGGVQFSGGLAFGALAAIVLARGRYSRGQRWTLLDGTAIALAVGLMVGRLGCIAVGEHFGGTTDFFLGMTYRGGGTVEPVEVGQTIHNTAFYELLHLAVLVALFAVLVRRAADRGQAWPPGMMAGIFFTWYGVGRFLTDTVRVNDARVAGLTGAQWASLLLVVFGVWLLVTAGNRRDLAGREMVPTTQEPQSAVTLVTGADAEATTTTGDAEARAPAGAGEQPADQATSTPDTATTDAHPVADPDVDPGDDDRGPGSDGGVASPTPAGQGGASSDEGATAEEADDEGPTETWAERATITPEGNRGFRSGVKVLEADTPGDRARESGPVGDGDAGRAAGGDASGTPTDAQDDGRAAPAEDPPRGATPPGGGHVSLISQGDRRSDAPPIAGDPPDEDDDADERTDDERA